ncbi:type VI secretion system tube protein Hcp [Methylobacterium sp. NEAU 140]|uniref:Hcp family type VI secretion system effector n=1 Tax=Methylobacterium sp. NEAU 140 TaxID=3064945 RepID=UPI002733CBFB|nr:type VI secretion system tube protein Hcp [Methylobacterium sp. NEAU 140]MDP4025127.1 type VI secretion system tube protein Hcp [Methylobacterium sp. NEAU 140]
MSIFVKFEGIDGDATEDGHKKWIAVDSFQFGVGRGISTPVGDAARRETSKPSISEVVFTKRMDAASLKLWESSLVENKGKKVEVHFTRTGDSGKLDVYAQYELTNSLISGYSVSSGGESPSESVSLNFTKVMYKWVGAGADNTDGSGGSNTFDLASAKMG